MAIDSITGRKPDLPAIKTAPKSEIDSSKKTVNTAGVKDDTVAITDAAQEIKKAFESSSETPIDANRVANIKKALADGSYKIDAENVAKKMIQSEQSFLEDNSP